MTTSIDLKGVTLDYKMYSVKAQSLRNAVLNVAVGGRLIKSGRDVTTLRALSDINLSLKEGDRLGLVGHNGSGKTSLLKVLAGIFEPTAGVVDVRGKVSSMISMSIGLDPEASGLQNIKNLAMMQMMSDREIKRRLPDIVEFSELGAFVHMPFKTYSAGMMARLTFSVATQMDADILIMDEWISAGDAEFQKRNLRSPHYAAPIAAPIALPADAPKIVAFYLPQFHPFPENDAWWGKGFTEWTNVSKAQPQFLGHYSPACRPTSASTTCASARCWPSRSTWPRTAGVSAFCFHYYWFAGKRLLERPIELYLSDPTLDLPFALCWANENWTRRWDGDESNVLMGQEHSPEDDAPRSRTWPATSAIPRYLRVGGKPVLVLYRPEILPDAKATTDRWREQARAMGLGELHLLCTTAFGFQDYASRLRRDHRLPAARHRRGRDHPPVTRCTPTSPARSTTIRPWCRHKLDELAAVDAAYVPASCRAGTTRPASRGPATPSTTPSRKAI
jgi:ABC-type polysaccharide/polyol phosphate transport system ATPase subunit